MLRKMLYFILILSIKYRRCGDCNEAVDDKYTFCTNCGKELQRYCSSCKKEIDLLKKYCGWCGNPISDFDKRAASDPLQKIVNKMQKKHIDHQINDTRERFGNALKSHANLRGFAINKASGKQRQVKEANKKVI
jgi:predicted amidophosphoribosyltransferase